MGVIQASPAPAGKGLKVRLLLNSAISGPHAFFCLAHERGYFADAGLDVSKASLCLSAAWFYQLLGDLDSAVLLILVVFICQEALLNVVAFNQPFINTRGKVVVDDLFRAGIVFDGPVLEQVEADHTGTVGHGLGDLGL